ncbi:MAG: sodium/solute symporter [Pirellulales bacterium]|nr:sodium/solute symporter [Pirellulales bacterium]
MDSPTNLLPIDYIIIATYLLGVMAIGIYFSRYIDTAGDFFLGGRALPFWAIGISVVASDIGATDMISGSGGAYRYGVSQANFDWLGSMPATVVAAFIFVPYYWRAGVFTIPEFLGRRYNNAVRMIQVAIWLVFMLMMIAIMFRASSVFLQELMGWREEWSIILMAVVVGVYTVSGGLTAVVMTDVIQLLVMFIGAAALLVLSVWEAGGWQGMTEAILAQGPETQHHFTLLLPHSADTPYPWTGIVFGLGLVLSSAYFVGNQVIVQRVLGARSEWDAKAGMVVAGLLKLCIPLLMFVPGLAARAIHPNLENPDGAVPTMIRELMPPGLTGLMFAAFFAALMSNIDSYLNSASTVYIADIHARVWKRATGHPMSDAHGLWLGRALTALLIVCAGLISPQIKEWFDTIYVAIQTMFSLFQGPTLVILLLGILWPRATGWGALAGLVSGVLLAGLLNILGDAVFPSDQPFLFVSVWTFLFSLVVTVVVSLLTRPESPEKLRGLVFGQVLRDADTQALLREQATGDRQTGAP